ncbi:MAG TPA: DUF4267 domain-containing protein [Pseudonocardia sp.]|jgi:hypothetical protein|nr:DUF4267 domain-containing protein [Pseudonocardia sp.]
MRKFGYAVAGLVSVGIIWVGTRYLVEPGAIAGTFGVPVPPPDTDPFLRVKGVRDVTSGLVMLALLATRQPRIVAIGLLAEALIPVGDATIVLANGGSQATAFGVHGATAALMVAGAVTLLRDGRRGVESATRPAPSVTRPASA